MELARWRLTGPHYINAYYPDMEDKQSSWEYTQLNDKGRQIRKRYKVPMYLDPKDPTCYNYPGEIIVANMENGLDIVMEGKPTMEMEPLNEEAKRLSDIEAPKWKNPMGVDAFPGTGGFQNELILKLERQIEGLLALKTVEPAPPVPVSSIPIEEFRALQKQMAELTAQNEALQTAKPAEADRRRA